MQEEEEEVVVGLEGIGTVENGEFWISSERGDGEKVMKGMRGIFDWNEGFEDIENDFLKR